MGVPIDLKVAEHLLASGTGQSHLVRGRGRAGGLGLGQGCG